MVGRNSNGGFSRCDPSRLYLPTNSGWTYGYQAVNVEGQRDQPASLLQWTRKMIAIRKNHPAFALGAFTDLGGSNPAVLSFAREYRDEGTDEVLLCVHNLSRRPKRRRWTCQRFAGHVPVELTGDTVFPRTSPISPIC